MCKCTPNIRTPFCGKPGCEWPPQIFKAEKSKVLVRAVLVFPKDTTVTIEGDAKIIEQLIDRLNGVEITYSL